MSFEGYYQVLCEDGHDDTREYDYSGDLPAAEDTFCEEVGCGKRIVFVNRVDQTNFGDSPSEVEIDFESFNAELIYSVVAEREIVVGADLEGFIALAKAGARKRLEILRTKNLIVPEILAKFIREFAKQWYFGLEEISTSEAELKQLENKLVDLSWEEIKVDQEDDLVEL